MKQVSDSGGKSTLRCSVACGRLTNMYSNNLDLIIFKPKQSKYLQDRLFLRFLAQTVLSQRGFEAFKPSICF